MLKNNEESAKEERFLPHPDFIKISYAHKREVSRAFRSALGHHYLSYIELYLITPDHEVIPFSSSPALPQNLINLNLWESDNLFSTKLHQENNLIPWRKMYSPLKENELTQIKEKDFLFEFGFAITRKLNDFYLIYSFATKEKNIPHSEYYKKNANDLIRIGDFLYRIFRGIAQKYTAHTVPVIRSFSPFLSGPVKDIGKKVTSPQLKLVINNSEKY